MRATCRNLLVLSGLLCGACDTHEHDHPPPPRPVSILVEVYDPATNLVWENVGVRVVEADQEWSQSTWISPYEDWYYTDADGLVLLDEYILAAAQVGFIEDGAGRAMLGPFCDEDQAVVLVELGALGFPSVFYEIDLSWYQPDVFVSLAFP